MQISQSRIAKKKPRGTLLRFVMQVLSTRTSKIILFALLEGTFLIIISEPARFVSYSVATSS